MMNQDQPEFYSEIKPAGPLTLNIKELIEYKELFYFFAWRDIKVKYRQTVLGFLWAVLQPLIMVFIFTYFFSRALNLPPGDMPYPVFVLSGLNLWMIFTSGIANAGNSMVMNASIIKKIYFPRLIIPVSSILVAVFDFLMAFLVFIAVLIYFKQPVNILQALVFWPAGLILTIVAAFGPGCLLAALNVKYRDFRYVIPFLIQIMLFITPVIYPISMLNQQWIQFVVALNPMYAALTIFRIPLSPAPVDATLITISVISGILLFVAGLYYFRKMEGYFADLA